MVSASKIIGSTLAFVAATAVNGQDDAIVNGTPVPQGEFEFLASLQNSGRSFCGGSLIRPRVVVTAAHCVENGSTNFQVRMKTVLANSGGKLAQPKKIYVHEGFRGSTLQDDIAIIELTSDVSDVTPIQHDTRSEFPSGEVTIAGYGRTRGGGQGSNRMLQIRVPIVPAATCLQAGSPFNQYLKGDGMICMGWRNGAELGGACQGDSGGPMVQNNILLGATSWGRPNCSAYGVYTRVGKYADWIQDKIDRIEGSGPSPTPPPTAGPGGDRCECIGTTAGITQGETCGTFGQSFNWCYSDVPCPGSTPSQRYDGYHWFRCDQSKFDVAYAFGIKEYALPDQIAALTEANEDFKFVNAAAETVNVTEEDEGVSAFVVAGAASAITGLVAAGAFVVFKSKNDKKHAHELQTYESNPSFKA